VCPLEALPVNNLLHFGQRRNPRKGSDSLDTALSL
jgi:hypothetical protein